MQETPTQQAVETSTGTSAEHGPSPGVMDISPYMMGLTWLTFLLVSIILYKVAWKPILAALEKRERDIKRSIDEAARVRAETARLEAVQKTMIATADDKAREIVDQARRAAGEVAETIATKARQEAQFMVENARHDIAQARDKATAALRRESAQLAIDLAGKVIRENLDEPKNRALVDKLVKEL